MKGEDAGLPTKAVGPPQDGGKPGATWTREPLAGPFEAQGQLKPSVYTGMADLKFHMLLKKHGIEFDANCVLG